MDTKLESQLDSYNNLLSQLDSDNEMTNCYNQMQLCFKGILDIQRMCAYLEDGGSENAVSELYDMRLYGGVPSMEGLGHAIGKVIVFLKNLITKFIGAIFGFQQSTQRRCTAIVASWRSRSTELSNILRYDTYVGHKLSKQSPPGITIHTSEYFASCVHAMRTIQSITSRQLQGTKTKLSRRLDAASLRVEAGTISNVLHQIKREVAVIDPATGDKSKYQTKRYTYWPSPDECTELFTIASHAVSTADAVCVSLKGHDDIVAILKQMNLSVDNLGENDRETCAGIRDILKQLNDIVRSLNRVYATVATAVEDTYNGIYTIIQKLYVPQVDYRT